MSDHANRMRWLRRHLYGTGGLRARTIALAFVKGGVWSHGIADAVAGGLDAPEMLPSGGHVSLFGHAVDAISREPPMPDTPPPAAPGFIAQTHDLIPRNPAMYTHPKIDSISPERMQAIDPTDTKPRDITDEEWLAVRTMRAVRFCGVSRHNAPGERCYFWPMGVQPTPEVIEKIAREDPIMAAIRYVAGRMAKEF